MAPQGEAACRSSAGENSGSIHDTTLAAQRRSDELYLLDIRNEAGVVFTLLRGMCNVKNVRRLLSGCQFP